MADFQNNFSLEDALTDNPPEVEAEIKRDFISSLEAEPYDDVVGETCGKADYIPLLDDDAAKCGNKLKVDGAEHAASTQPPVLENGERGMEEHFGKDPFEENRGDDLLSDQILLPSWDMKSRPAFTEHFGAAGDLPGFMAVPQTNFFSDPSSDTLVMGTAAILSPHSPKSPTDTPGEEASERSPWETASFPVDLVNENTRSHWQPTIQEQQKLGMHHKAEPSRPAEFTLLEASAAAGTSAELAGVAEFADWQHAQPAGEPSASTLVQDVGGHPVEKPVVNLFSFQVDAKEANPYLGQPSDPPLALAGDVLMELKFEETRAPADGACAVEVEKHLADSGGHPEPLHAPAGEIFEELKANISQASAPAVMSPFEGQKRQVEASGVYRPEDFILDASAPVKQGFMPSSHGCDRAKPVALPVADTADQQPFGLLQHKTIEPHTATESYPTKATSRTKTLHKKAADLMEAKRESVQEGGCNDSAAAMMMKKKKKKPKQKKGLQPQTELSVGLGAEHQPAEDLPKCELPNVSFMEDVKEENLKAYAEQEASQSLGKTNTGADLPVASVEELIQHLPTQLQLQNDEGLTSAEAPVVGEKAVNRNPVEGDKHFSQSRNKHKINLFDTLQYKPDAANAAAPALVTAVPKETVSRNKSKKRPDLKASFAETKKQIAAHLGFKAENLGLFDNQAPVAERSKVSIEVLEGKYKQLDNFSLDPRLLGDCKSDDIAVPIVLKDLGVHETSIVGEIKKEDYSIPDFATEFEKDKAKVYVPTGSKRGEKPKKSRNSDRKKKVERSSMERFDIYESKTDGEKGQRSSVTRSNESNELIDKKVEVDTILSDDKYNVEKSKHDKRQLSYEELVGAVEVSPLSEQTVSECIFSDPFKIGEKGRDSSTTSLIDSQKMSKHKPFENLSSDLPIVVETKNDMFQVKASDEPALPAKSKANEALKQISLGLIARVNTENDKVNEKPFADPIGTKAELGQVQTSLRPAVPIENTEAKAWLAGPSETAALSASMKGPAPVQVSSDAQLPVKAEMAHVQLSFEPLKNKQDQTLASAETPVALSEDKAQVLQELLILAESVKDKAQVTSDHVLSMRSKKALAQRSSELPVVVDGKNDKTEAPFEPSIPVEGKKDQTLAHVSLQPAVLLESNKDTTQVSSVLGISVAIQNQVSLEPPVPLESEKDMVPVLVWSEPVIATECNKPSSLVQVMAEPPVALESKKDETLFHVSSELPVAVEGSEEKSLAQVLSEQQTAAECKKSIGQTSAELEVAKKNEKDVAQIKFSVPPMPLEDHKPMVQVQMSSELPLPVKSKTDAVEEQPITFSKQGKNKESDASASKKAGRGSLKRPRSGDPKGAKVETVGQTDDRAKEHQHEGKGVSSKYPFGLDSKTNLPQHPPVPLDQDIVEAKDRSPSSFDLEGAKMGLYSVTQEDRKLAEAASLSEYSTVDGFSVQYLVNTDICDDRLNLSSLDNHEEKHIEKTQVDEHIVNLPLHYLEGTGQAGQDPTAALTQDNLNKRLMVEEADGLPLVPLVSLEGGATTEVLSSSRPEETMKASLTDMVKPTSIGSFETSTDLEMKVAIEKFPDITQLDDQLKMSLIGDENFEILSADPLAIVEKAKSATVDELPPQSKVGTAVAVEVTATALVKDNTRATLGDDVKHAECGTFMPSCVSNIISDDSLILPLEDKIEEICVSDEFDELKILSFEPLSFVEGSPRTQKVPSIVQGSSPKQLGVTAKEGVLKDGVRAGAHEKAARPEPADIKRGMKEEKSKATEQIKGYMRPTQARGLQSPLPRSPIPDVAITRPARDRSTSQRRPEKVISQASPSIEDIAGSITTAPSKDLPQSPDKKVKASSSAKPAAATKGRPTSVSSPKQSTPPPGKKAASPAPVASSTPKRPASSSARISTLTPKDSNTPRSSTLSPKEMRPKGLELKSPVKSPEKKTPLSKPATTPTTRPTSRTPVGTPKAAMVPALAVASKSTTSTTPRRPTTIKTEAKPVEAKKTTNAKSADPSRPRTAPANFGKSNATTPSSPGTNSAPGAPLSRPKPSKLPGTKPIPESNSTGDKKLPAAKAPVSKGNTVPKATRPVTVAAPDLKNVRSKIGSTDNLKHQPGGGRANLEKKPVPMGLPRMPAAPLPVTKTASTKTTVSKETEQKDTNGKVQIMNKKVDTSKVSSKCGSKANIKHKPGGGEVKIESHRSIPKDKVQAKVASLDNMGHVPAGGKVKSEGSEEAGDLAQTPQNGDLSTPQTLAGSETQQNGVLTEGSDQRETQNLDSQIQETSI